jgi:hypothetical protein
MIVHQCSQCENIYSQGFGTYFPPGWKMNGDALLCNLCSSGRPTRDRRERDGFTAEMAGWSPVYQEQRPNIFVTLWRRVFG